MGVGDSEDFRNVWKKSWPPEILEKHFVALQTSGKFLSGSPKYSSSMPFIIHGWKFEIPSTGKRATTEPQRINSADSSTFEASCDIKNLQNRLLRD